MLVGALRAAAAVGVLVSSARTGADDLRQDALLGLLESCRRPVHALVRGDRRRDGPLARADAPGSGTRPAARGRSTEAIWLDGGNDEMPAVEGTDPAVAVLVREQLRMFVRELPEAVELACQPDVSQRAPASGDRSRAARDPQGRNRRDRCGGAWTSSRPSSTRWVRRAARRS